jgi:hypothetical protein
MNISFSVQITSALRSTGSYPNAKVSAGRLSED